MVRPPVVAIVPAAGSGVRLGGAIPKALVEIAGEPLVRRTVTTLVASGWFDRIVVPVPAGSEGAFSAALADLSSVALITGGAERQASVARALAYIEQTLPNVFPDGTLFVHDAARCLLDRALVERCLTARERSRAVSAAVPVVDTCVRGDGRGGMGTGVDRTELYAIQTPQVFEAGLLAAAHARGVTGATDDAALVAPLARVVLVEGDRMNIKITGPADLAFATAVLEGRARGTVGGLRETGGKA